MTHLAVLAMFLTAGHVTQRPVMPHVFGYGPEQLPAWYLANHVSSSSIVEVDGKKVDANSKANPLLAPTEVQIEGNFGGVFNVEGAGSGTSMTAINAVSVRTNRPLTFSTNSFKPLMAGNTSAQVMGSITYSMALYQGTQSRIGSLVSGPITGTDAGFNGQALYLIRSQIPVDGNFVLVITRTLNLTDKALGTTTLVGTGNIGVTIN